MLLGRERRKMDRWSFGPGESAEAEKWAGNCALGDLACSTTRSAVGVEWVVLEIHLSTNSSAPCTYKIFHPDTGHRSRRDRASSSDTESPDAKDSSRYLLQLREAHNLVGRQQHALF